MTPQALQRFRLLVADAHQAAPSEAIRLLVEGLRVAAAPPGDEPLRGLPLMVAIEDERVRAAVRAVEHGIRSGMAADIVPSLRGVAAEHPLDEPLQAALIRCLHAAGRPAQGLTVYGRTRDRLRDEIRIGDAGGVSLRLRHTGRSRTAARVPAGVRSCVDAVADRQGQEAYTSNSESWPAGQPVLAVKLSRT
ncbi:BTAD domain-containing putative transcriptional regulator [Micromonospora sp. NPDC048999]|uniref:BTAD domain-containing putative transcriptional regulator n=1 Tax=Micromonospora sp. NPDC048999 TaxID=3155391 RepID=UPI0033C7DAEB